MRTCLFGKDSKQVGCVSDTPRRAAAMAAFETHPRLLMEELLRKPRHGIHRGKRVAKLDRSCLTAYLVCFQNSRNRGENRA